MLETPTRFDSDLGDVADLFREPARTKLETEFVQMAGQTIRRIQGEFWTAGQRQASSIHEVSYRACFKPQLPVVLHQTIHSTRAGRLRPIQWPRHYRYRGRALRQDRHSERHQSARNDTCAASHQCPDRFRGRRTSSIDQLQPRAGCRSGSLDVFRIEDRVGNTFFADVSKPSPS